MQFMYMKSGVLSDSQVGPVSLAQLANLFRKGVVKEKTPICLVGTTHWVELGSSSEVLAACKKLIAQEIEKEKAQAQEIEAKRQRIMEEEAQAAKESRFRQQDSPRPEEPPKPLPPLPTPPASTPLTSTPVTSTPAATAFSDSPRKSTGSRTSKKRGNYFTFDRFVTPIYIKIIWIISNVLIIFALLANIGLILFGLITTLFIANEDMNVTQFIFSIVFSVVSIIGLIIGALLLLLCIRVLLECIMVIFRCSRSLDLLAGLEPPFDEF